MFFKLNFFTKMNFKIQLKISPNYKGTVLVSQKL